MNNQGLRVFFSVLIVLAALASVWAVSTFFSFLPALLLAVGAGVGLGFMRKKTTELYVDGCRYIPYRKKFVIFFHWYFIVVALLVVISLTSPPMHRAFNTGLFWLVAATSLVMDWLLMYSRQGVYIGDKKRIYIQQAQLRGIDASYVFYLEEKEDRIRFRYRFSSTTLCREDFAEEDWIRLQKEIEDWSARNGIAEEARS